MSGLVAKYTVRTAPPEHPILVLVGQPNSGKSTIFNRVAGYQSISTNFPGTTVSFTQSHVRLGDRTFDLIDLPGIYSLTLSDRAGEDSRAYLLTQPISLIINVVDASLLSRSLSLTLQLIELGRPMVICLNMMDEAERKGMVVDVGRLSALLGVPVIATRANKGDGVDALFDQVFQHLLNPDPPTVLPMTRHVEDIVARCAAKIAPYLAGTSIPPRLAAIKMLEGDPYFKEMLAGDSCSDEEIQRAQQALMEPHGQPADVVISSEWHAMAMRLFEKSVRVGSARLSRRAHLDDVLMHPLWGYVSMLAIMLMFFVTVFKIGAILEKPILALFAWTGHWLQSVYSSHSLWYSLLQGLLQGVSGGTTIILPYLGPFLIGMALMEDIGYLPRVAFLMDGFMHKMGLHGTAVIPGILGYGCSVPAVMATRILSSPRDRFIASVVAILVPCSARMMIIMGLVGFYLGGVAAFLLYLFNLIVITLTGALLTRMMPEDNPGLVMEIPSYQWPQAKSILAKTWLRMKDFVIFAWPILIIGSLALSLSTYYHMDHFINQALSPLTRLLDLPQQVGVTLIFGILRKELSLVMLMQALGTADIGSVLSNIQMVVFTLFVIFYFPCLATWGILGREIGWPRAIIAAVGSLILAVVIALSARWLLPLIL